MIAQEYALAHPETLLSVTFACTYGAPGPFCTRMFATWAELAPVMGVPFIMREVSLWAFTTTFFETRIKEVQEFEEAMAYMDQPTHAYLSQLHAIRQHNTLDRVGAVTVPTLVLAGEEDILIPVALSKQLSAKVPHATFALTRGGHGCMWEYPTEFNAAFLNFLASL
jgi:pimeloyl-ACP methyl ester carboxylesterase